MAARSGGSSTTSAATRAFPATRSFAGASGATFYLSSHTGDDGALVLRLCDGTRTWRGELRPHDLTPPKQWLAAKDGGFRARLLEGLHGPLDERNKLAVEACAGGVRLAWKATTDADVMGLTRKLGQSATLKAELLAGEGLRELLGELVDESEAHCRACAEGHARARRLEAEHAELDAVESRLAARADQGAARRASLLGLVNRKKRRIAALDEVLERHEEGLDTGSVAGTDGGGDEGDDGSASAPSRRGAGSPAADADAEPMDDAGSSSGEDPINML